MIIHLLLGMILITLIVILARIDRICKNLVPSNKASAIIISSQLIAEIEAEEGSIAKKSIVKDIKKVFIHNTKDIIN